MSVSPQAPAYKAVRVTETHTMSGLLLLSPVVAVLAIAACFVRWRIRRASLPPGPPGHLLLGHMDLVKSPRLHLLAADWAAKYGGHSHFIVAIITDNRLLTLRRHGHSSLSRH